jgi:hypothetical protein
MNIAKIDLDSLFPLIIGAIWIIAQILSAAARKKQARPEGAGQPAPSGKTGDDPFAELMRKLGGVQEFKIPDPPEPEPVFIDTPPPTADAVPPPRPAPAQDAVVTPRLRSDELSTVDIRPTMSSFRTAMPSMKLPAMNLSFQTSEKQGHGLPRVGKIISRADKQALRRAVLGHIILGKPKALEGWNTGTVE